MTNNRCSLLRRRIKLLTQYLINNYTILIVNYTYPRIKFNISSFPRKFTERNRFELLIEDIGFYHTL